MKMESPNVEDYVIIDGEELDQDVAPQTPETLAAIQRWLQPTDYQADSSEYAKHLGSHVEGTGSWMQETEAFKKWHDSPHHGSLWTKATAGAGKSVFAAMIADQLQKIEHVPVLSFFFRQIVATNHHPQSLARDFISQVLNYSPSLQAKIKMYMDERRSLDNFSAGELWLDLTQALVLLPKVYCVIDALDEMDIDQEPFLDKLVDLGKQNPASIKVLLTSRPLPRIEAKLKTSSVLQMRLDQHFVDKDIAIYINHRLELYADLDHDLRTAIQQAILQRAQGSFLYSRLMMDELLIGHFPHMALEIKYIQRSLDWLPITLEDMYNGMLLDHSLRSGVSQKLQVTILAWVTHSTRPLRLLELAAMLDAESGKKGRDTKSVVRGACGPLLEILEDETVSVIHHSFTEFLTNTSRGNRPAPGNIHPQFPVVEPITTHRNLAIACINYLQSGCLSDEAINDTSTNISTLQRSTSNRSMCNLQYQYPFVDYAAKNWYVHTSKLGDLDEDMCSRLDSFIKPDAQEFSAWLELEWHIKREEATRSPLHVAAWAKMPNYAAHLLASGSDPNQLDWSKKVPLTWAALKGCDKTTTLLLKNTSNPDVDDLNGKKPLHYAAQANHPVVVKLLLEAGVSPLTPKTRENTGPRCGNGPTSKGHTPLRYAILAGSTESVREMIPYLAIEDLNNALCTAAWAGQADIVDLLLSCPGVLPDAPDLPDTPLYLGACCRNQRILQSLLKKGANPTRTSENHINRNSMSASKNRPSRRSPFHGLAGLTSRNSQTDGNAKACFEILLEAGCDVNFKDETGRTPIYSFVGRGSRGSFIISKLLIENGADLSVFDEKGNTPLHLTSLQSSSDSIVELMLRHGADIMAKRPSDGMTPLHVMLKHPGQLDLNVLLPYVSDWNVQDCSGNTPLHVFLEHTRHPENTLQVLLNAGASPNVKNKRGLVPLQLIKYLDNLSIEGPESVVTLLVKGGADLEIRDTQGCTPFLRAINGRGFEEKSMARLLFDAGANLHAVDFGGNGVLHLLCKRGNPPAVATMESLIKDGLDPLRVNNEGNTLIHELLKDYKTGCRGPPNAICDTMKFLLKKGIRAAARNNVGWTAMHYVCACQASLFTNYIRNEFDASDPLSMFFESEIGQSRDAEDNHGVRPIHLAATISEVLVSKLLEYGADFTATIEDGRNVLHVAAVARQSNIIGLILDFLRDMSRLDLINSPDEVGRTPLHEACRSGRPESVALLLDAGADANLVDKEGNTALHVCAEFEEEQRLWFQPMITATGSIEKVVDAKGFMKVDASRPAPREMVSVNWKGIFTDSDTARTTDIIGLLVANGLGFEVRNGKGLTALDVSIEKGCEETTRELKRLIEEQNLQSQDLDYSPTKSFRLSYLTIRSQSLRAILEHQINVGESNLELCHELLALREFDAIRLLPELGVKFGPYRKKAETDFLSTLTIRGYSDLLSNIGSKVSEAGWVNGRWLPHQSSSQQQQQQQEQTVQPYLKMAVISKLSNLAVMKVLVEQFGADVNMQQKMSISQRDNNYIYKLGDTAMHALAESRFWWYKKGLQYILEHGGNPNIRNHVGCTVLHIAVSKRVGVIPCLQREITRILLTYGADANTRDDADISCLNKASHDPQIVRMLIEAGASVNNELLYSAITAYDTETVNGVLKAGIQPNVLMKNLKYNASENVYPLHYAASYRFQTKAARPSATTIIDMLFNYGADPWLALPDGTTIIHDTLARGGIFAQFLARISDEDIERKDDAGRTLLLAACDWTPTNPNRYPGIATDNSFREGQSPVYELLERGADLTATSNDGNTVLHHLLLAPMYNNPSHQEIFTHVLSRASAAINIQNSDGQTPFLIAIQMHKKDSTELLLSSGADPNISDSKGNTALHYLCSRSSERTHPDTFSLFQHLLTTYNLPINGLNSSGESPLFTYLSNYIPDKALTDLPLPDKLLAPFLDAGADFQVRNGEGEGLLHVIAKKGKNRRSDRRDHYVELFQFLVGLGLDPMLEDQSQRTALDVASACGSVDILELFKREKK